MAEPLIDRAELLVWLRGTGNAPDLDDADAVAFLEVVTQAAEIVVRGAGSEGWTLADSPPRARLIALLMAHDYFANPDRLVSESTGPLSERRVDDVVRGMNLTDEQRGELAVLAGAPPAATGGAGRLWRLGGTDQRTTPVQDTIFVTAGLPVSDWGFPMYAVGDVGSPDPLPEV